MRYLYPDSVIQVFCKAPIAGTVKTRLMTVLTADQAVEVHKQLSQRTFELVGNGGLAAMQIWCSPDIEHDFFTQATAEFAATLHRQQGDDLGERMHHAINAGLRQYRNVILVGCDCPSLSMADLQQAIHALSHHADVVLAPAEDGGYVLIGLNRPEKSLFSDMRWGAPSVLQVTHKRIQSAQLRLHELAEQWDVDTEEDLERWLLM
ncbi:MAG: TIGR04282 family arsenosugar biosynthesis glycosyltransferase [Methyloprofundus sp.]|nr:TIGR04282 family arsenosugar biosynthesis glycosyltransferase [Methyloprofundus sp.]